MIKVNDLTLKYKSGKGIFNIDFTVKAGEVVGYLGPNGAGKTTTIRTLMGFMKCDSGFASINGFDCFTEALKIQRFLGYIPGEIAFFDDMNGDEFLMFINNMRGTKDQKKQKELLDMFEFSPKGKIKKFSKGMKQKLGIVAAFMHDPEVIIFDEPTSGLDPLMQNRFIDLILQEKKKGKTMLMSSHMFEEVERTCNEILIIKDGKIISKSDVHSLKSSQRKGFIIKTNDIEKAAKEFESLSFQYNRISENILEVYVSGTQIDLFIKTLSAFKLLDFDVKNQTLEDIFMKFYGKEAK